jgi:adenylate kinase family enzyme
LRPPNYFTKLPYQIDAAVFVIPCEIYLYRMGQKRVREATTMKIAILGYSGSGKSTLAKRLADSYKIPLLFLDTVKFLPNWAERDKEEGREIVNSFMQNESWVIDGNYNAFFQKERLEQANQIILLTFPRRVCLYRAFKRYFQNRNCTRESMADGCIEKIDFKFIWWILHEGRTKKRSNHYKQIASLYQDKTVILKNQTQVNKFMKQIEI